MGSLLCRPELISLVRQGPEIIELNSDQMCANLAWQLLQEHELEDKTWFMFVREENEHLVHKVRGALVTKGR